MREYVCGFLFSPDRKKVLLIRKRRPAWQAGKLNGVGGKVDSTLIIVARPIGGARVDSVRIRPDTLRVTAQGLEAAFAAAVHPDALSQAVLWKSLDTATARVSSAGMVSGRQAGTARVVATSALDVRTVAGLMRDVEPGLGGPPPLAGSWGICPEDFVREEGF